MRVAHVITRMIVGGAQENTLFNCLDLQRIYGDDVILITGPSLGPEGDLLQQGRAEGLKVILLPDLVRAIDPVRDWKALRAIRQTLRDFQPDVVHTHSAKGGILGRQAAHDLGVPAILHTVHGAPFHPYQSPPVRWFYKACEKRAAGQCHRLISVADAMTRLLTDAEVVAAEKCTTVYSGMNVDPFLWADTHRLAVRQRLGIGDDEVVVGKIARLFHLKGHADLIQAATTVVKAHANVKFLLIGDGILRDELTDQIRQAGLEDRFCFTGLVPPEDIPEYLGAMDLLVHTSYREGLARALPQALIAGKPVISYAIDGAPEVVIDGETGFLVSAGDIDRLADRIVELVGDKKMRADLGGQGRARFTDAFRHETMTSRLREIYQQILADSAGGDR
ncbi:glycosyltransferase family 4 protein [Rosistilla oblonga]|uniref:glycosyltransferase family 4 protein n=1 Tax=Rosistilla oblonga TaxID=2527990 RepID=UPI003A971AC0